MKHRYFFIEPDYSDPDVHCRFIVGSNDIRSSLSMYADVSMIEAAAIALRSPALDVEAPVSLQDDWIFSFRISVLPHDGGKRVLRFQFFKFDTDSAEDAVEYKTDIRFYLTKESAEELSKELLQWCKKPDFVFSWIL